jgi:phosphatidylglycerophosphate synthase
MSITPNQISKASILAAGLAGGAFWWAGHVDGWARASCLITAALFCQIRLLCNLFDGMVAIEGAKGEADGPFWNEFPDRLADTLIFAGVGLGTGAAGLAWAAVSFAIFTAYVRELGRSICQTSDFSGPMAKPQRMAIITLAALLSPFEPIWNGRNEVLNLALLIIAVGAAVTVIRRAHGLVRHLKV